MFPLVCEYIILRKLLVFFHYLFIFSSEITSLLFLNTFFFFFLAARANENINFCYVKVISRQMIKKVLLIYTSVLYHKIHGLIIRYLDLFHLANLQIGVCLTLLVTIAFFILVSIKMSFLWHFIPSLLQVSHA